MIPKAHIAFATRISELREQEDWQLAALTGNVLFIINFFLLSAENLN